MERCRSSLSSCGRLLDRKLDWFGLSEHALAAVIANADVHCSAKQPVFFVPGYCMPNTDFATAPGIRRFVCSIDRYTLAVVMLKVTLLERAGTPIGCIFFQSHIKSIAGNSIRAGMLTVV